jgi:trigger factor
MQTEIESINTYSKKLKVEISPDDLVPIEQKLVKDYQRKVSIPGFRPGKAPLNIVRQRYKEVIEQELIEEAIRRFYNKALQEADINPVSQGKVTDLQFKDNKTGMKFEIEVEVEPEVELKNYKGLKVEKEVVDVSEEMIDRTLQQIREQYATIKEIEQAKENHFVSFDAQELDKGDIPILGHKYENLQVQLGSGKFDPEVERQLIGIKKGEKRIVRMETSAQTSQTSQEPQMNSLEIHAKKIEEKRFPELNDEFVKNLDDDRLENLEQLKGQVRENIKLDLAQRSENLFQNRLIDELLKENPSDVPPTMVEHYLEHMIKDIKNQSKDQNIDEESVRKEYRPAAIRNMRWYFLKKALADIENVSVSDQEVLKIIEESNIEEKTKKKIKSDKHYLDHLKEDLIEGKLLEILKSHAEVTEIYPLQKKSPEIKREFKT